MKEEKDCHLHKFEYLSQFSGQMLGKFWEKL